MKYSYKKYLMALVILLGTGSGIWMIKHIRTVRHYMPKPSGYPRIVLPTHEYRDLPQNFPYSLEYSKHAVLGTPSSPVEGTQWVDIYYPAFEAKIHLTYKKVKNKKQLQAFEEAAYKLVTGHQVKATSIEEYVIQTPQKLSIIVVELEGEVPSQFQFYTTRTQRHFLRGSLYFNTATQNDYLAPIIDYIKRDIIHMLNTLHWKEKQEITSS